MKQVREIISTAEAPRAIGPYSQAIRCGGLLFVSGMIAIDPKSGDLLSGNFEAEVRLALDNLEAVIKAGGMGLENVVKTTVFLADLANFGKFNEIYAEYFGTVLPARETVQPAKLPRGASIEISAICAQ